MLSGTRHTLPLAAATGAYMPSLPARARRRRGALLLLLSALVLLAGCGGSASASNPSNITTAPRATATATPPATYGYVAMGASDAVGVGADDPNTQGYVPLLIAELPTTVRPLNLGVSGIVLHDALKQELPQAIAAQPKLVTVWLVGNDFRSCAPLTQYGADLDALLTALQTQTHAQVFVANTPDMSLLPYFAQQHAPLGGACVQGATPEQVHALVLQWNAVINPIIARHGDVLVDLYNSDLVGHPEYISPRDGFHPSSKGYVRLAEAFWAQITAHKAVPSA